MKHVFNVFVRVDENTKDDEQWRTVINTATSAHLLNMGKKVKLLKADGEMGKPRHLSVFGTKPCAGAGRAGPRKCSISNARAERLFLHF